MPVYNFNDNFSWMDFERFARDIIEVREGVKFKLSKRGKDKGIDFSHRSDNEFIIGQAKKYSNYLDLKSILKQSELQKVRRLKPSRYILVTSLHLTNGQVKEIQRLFEGYIIDENDILGKHELNVLLNDVSGKYKAVERNHPKLWLSSSGMLTDFIDDAVNRDQNNNVDYELEKIQSTAKIYVKNQSFEEAHKTLVKSNYVIISGTPGSGKTTLARMLVLNCLRQGFELITVSYTIQDAWKRRDKSKKQVFLFDDFLGSYQLDQQKASITPLNRLLQFIEWIQGSSNSYLILTTREYILQHGQIVLHNQLKEKEVNLNKCVVDVSRYTRYEKAEILFNHLYFSEVRRSYLDFLSDLDNINDIIEHPNYSPRLIEDFVHKVNIDKEDVYGIHWHFRKYLSDPYSYWESVFKDQSISARLILLALFSAGEPMLLPHLEKAYEGLVNAYIVQSDDLVRSPDLFENSLKELCDTFIRTDEYFSGLEKVSFQNPSLNDFFLKFLSENEFYIDLIINGLRYWNQYLQLFISHRYDNGKSRSRILDGKIILTRHQDRMLYEKLMGEFPDLLFSQLEDDDIDDTVGYYRTHHEVELRKLLDLIHSFDLNDPENHQLLSNCLDRIHELFSDNDTDTIPLGAFQLEHVPRLVSSCNGYHNLSPELIIRRFYNSINLATLYFEFNAFSKVFPKEYEAFLEENIHEIRKRIRSQIIDDLYYFDPYDPDESEYSDLMVDFRAEGIFEIYGMRMTKQFIAKMRLAAYDETEEDREEKIQRRKESYNDSTYKKEQKSREAENKQIQSLFQQPNISKVDALKEFPRKRREPFHQYLSRVVASCLGNVEYPDQVDHFLKKLAFDSLKKNKNDLSLNYLQTVSSNLTSDALEKIVRDINPILTEFNGRFYFDSDSLRDYFFLLYLLEMPKVERHEFILNEYRDITYDHDQDDFWSLWREYSSDSFYSDLVVTSWNDLVLNIDLSSKDAFFSSYCRVTRNQFDIEYNSKTQESTLNSQSVYGSPFSDFLFATYFGQWDVFDIPCWFFESDFYENERFNPGRFGHDCFSQLMAFMQENCPVNERTKEWLAPNVLQYEVNFSRMVEHNQNFLELLNQLGVVDFIYAKFQEVDKKVKSGLLELTKTD